MKNDIKRINLFFILYDTDKNLKFSRKFSYKSIYDLYISA